MARTPPRYYWDANAWIAYIRREMPTADNGIKDPRFTMCQEVLKRAEAGEIEIVTSSFTLAEVCKKRSEIRGPQVNLPAFFDQPFILQMPVDKEVGLRAQQLQLSGVGSLKPADATHVASALIGNVQIFHTFDDGLLKLSKVLTLSDGRQLQIVKPTKETPEPDLLRGMRPDDDED